MEGCHIHHTKREFPLRVGVAVTVPLVKEIPSTVALVVSSVPASVAWVSCSLKGSPRAAERRHQAAHLWRLQTP